MSKRDFGWLFACGILVVLLIVAVVLGMTGYFSSVSYLHSNADLKVGDTVSVAVRPNETSVVSFTFDGSILPNESIPQVVQINGQILDENVRVRVKAQVFGSDDNFGFLTTDHFTLDEDGYYYFDDVLMGGSKITFCKALVVPNENDFVGDEKYILSIVVETIDVEHESFWKYFDV